MKKLISLTDKKRNRRDIQLGLEHLTDALDNADSAEVAIFEEVTGLKYDQLLDSYRDYVYYIRKES